LTGFGIVSVIDLVSTFIEWAIYLYAAYWAFSISRALNVSSYKAQAFFVGAISLYAFLGDLSPQTSSNSIINFLIVSYYAVLPVLIFFWADSSIRLGRRSDPLVRDTFQWKNLRIFIFAIIVLGLILSFGSFILVSGSALFGSGSASLILTFGLFLLYFPPLVAATPALFLVSRRSGDPVFHRSLKWFTFGLFSYLIGIVIFSLPAVGVNQVNTTTLILLSIALNIAITVAAYCLYRCGRALAPVNRLESIHQ